MVSSLNTIMNVKNTIAMIDKEFFQMVSANTAQLSKELPQITHTIAKPPIAALNKDYFLLDIANSADLTK